MRKLLTLLIAFHLMVIPVPKAHASGLAGMANQLRGIAIGGIAATILVTCPLGSMAPSLKVFMGAGLIYILGELAAGKSQKGAIESEDAKVKSMEGMGGETQLATLEAQLKDKKEKKKVADKRAMFGAASAAAMAAAAAVAAGEIVPETTIGVPPPAGCTVPTAMAQAKLKAAAIAAAFSFLTGGGMMGSLISGIGLYAMGLSSMVTMLNTAKTRVIAFGALAAMTLLAVMDAKKESSKLAKEIKQLEEVIAQFRRETDDPGDQLPDERCVLGGCATGGSTSGSTSGVQSGSLAGTTSGSGPGTISSLPEVQEPTTRTCFSSSGPSSDCTNPLRVPSVNLSGLGSGPELQRVASQTVDLANDLSSGNAGAKADVAAASLASSASKVDEQLKKQIAKSNAFLKSKGKKGMDFDKEVADTVNSMNSAVQNEANKSGTSLASLGLTNAQLDPNAAKAAQEIASASSSTTLAVPTSNGDGKAVAENANVDTSFTQGTFAKPEESAASSLGKNLDEYESSESDISKNSSDSLWKQVSNRYLLNYDRFFEKKKLPAQ